MRKPTVLYRHDELTGLNIRVTKEDRAFAAFDADPRVKQAYEQLACGLVHPTEYARYILSIAQESGI
jgi:hypothetical protein